MAYTYLLEKKANKNYTVDDILNKTGGYMLHILCYNVEEQLTYPFLQFMMEKVPYCNNIVKEQITLPYIFISDKITENIETIFERIKTGLYTLNCDYIKLTEDMYKGIVFINNNNVISSYALINISGIEITGINFTRQTSTWFVLPSEIINTKTVCNIPIDKDIVQLFTDIPYIGQLVNTATKEFYIIPDAVYTGNDIKQSKFYSVFGNNKTKVYASCSEYYYFQRTFSLAVKDGGWFKELNNKTQSGELLRENNTKCIDGAINRYALFVEGKLYMETGKDFSLSDDIIETYYPEPCIIICYSGEHNMKPDLLVKNTESFVCLSYHRLNTELLDDTFIESNKLDYMIA